MDMWEGALALFLCYWIPYRSRGTWCIVVFWHCWSTGVPDLDVSTISRICTVLIFDADFTKHGFSGLEDYIELFCLCIGEILGEAGSILFVDALVRSKRSLIGVAHKLGGWLLNIRSIQSHIHIPCNLRSALRCHRRLAVSPHLLSLRLDWYAQSIGCRWLQLMLLWVWLVREDCSVLVLMRVMGLGRDDVHLLMACLEGVLGRGHRGVFGGHCAYEVLSDWLIGAVEIYVDDVAAASWWSCCRWGEPAW